MKQPSFREYLESLWSYVQLSRRLAVELQDSCAEESDDATSAIWQAKYNLTKADMTLSALRKQLDDACPLAEEEVAG